MYLLWLQGNHSEGWYQHEENGKVFTVAYAPKAKKFPTRETAEARGEILKKRYPIVMEYTVTKYHGKEEETYDFKRK